MSLPDRLADRIRCITTDKAVPGLLFKITADRMRKHCTDRAAYHAQRAKDKQEQIPRLEESIKSMREAIDTIKGNRRETAAPMSMSNKTSASYGFDAGSDLRDLEEQIDNLRNDIKDHANKSATFMYLSESVIGSDYILEWADLQRLELAR